MSSAKDDPVGTVRRGFGGHWHLMKLDQAGAEACWVEVDAYGLLGGLVTNTTVDQEYRTEVAYRPVSDAEWNRMHPIESWNNHE